MNLPPQVMAIYTNPESGTMRVIPVSDEVPLIENSSYGYAEGYAAGWNAAIAKVAEMNSAHPREEER